MSSLRSYIESWWNELPRPTAARWASLFFSLHILTLLLSVAASQAFLAAATITYLTHLLGLAIHQPADSGLRHVPSGTWHWPAVVFPLLKLPLLLFGLATFNSMLWAEHPAAGWVALRKLVLFVILLLSVNLVASAKHLGALFRGLFFVSGLAGLLGIAQFLIQYQSVQRLHHNSIYFYMTLTRIHGFMGHWMNFGGQQMLVFAALLAFLVLSHGGASSPPRREEGLGGGGGQNQDSANHPLAPSLTRRGIQKDREHGKAKVLYWLAMAVVATSLILNFTRGAWLGCVVATLYIVARWKPRALWVIPFLVALAYLAAPSMLRRRLALTFHPKDDPALAIRLEMWNAGLRMVQKHPWVGVGPEHIPLVYAQYLPPGTTPLAGYHDHLHDNFLQLAAERGLPCLAVWLWFMLALGWHILKIRRGLLSLRWVGDAALAAWLAFLAEGFSEFNFGASPVLMVFLFVMSTPFIAQHLESRTTPPPHPTRADESAVAGHPLPQGGAGWEL